MLKRGGRRRSRERGGSSGGGGKGGGRVQRHTGSSQTAFHLQPIDSAEKKERKNN